MSGGKVGVDDYLVKYGREAFQKLLDEAEPFDPDSPRYASLKRKPGEPRGRPLPLIDICEFIAKYPARRAPVFDGLLRRGEVENFVSLTKRGKSWAEVGRGIALATGQPWLGRFNTRPGKVLYVDNELHNETLSYRLQAVADAMSIRVSELKGRFVPVPLRGDLRTMRELRLDLHASGVRPGEYDLLIIDAQYRTYWPGLCENDNAQMAEYYNAIDALAAEFDFAVSLVHHGTKGDQSEKAVTDVGAGAGAMSRAADTHLILREHEEEGAAVLEVALRSFAPVEPMALRWAFPVWVPAPDLDPKQLKRRGSRKQQSDDDAAAADAVAGAIEALEREKKELSIYGIRCQTGFNVDKVQRAVTVLGQRGQFARTQVRRMNNKGEPALNKDGSPSTIPGVRRV
jgi:hypothetical protein